MINKEKCLQEHIKKIDSAIDSSDTNHSSSSLKKEGTNWGLKKRGITEKGFQFDSDSMQGKLETLINGFQQQGIGVGLTLSEEENAIRLSLFDITIS